MKKKNNFWKGIAGALAIIIAGLFGLHQAIQAPDQYAPNIDTVKVSSVLYGINGNLSNSPINYSDAAFRQAIARLHPQIIRWPGGSVSNNFNPLTGTADDGSGTPNKIEDLALLVKEAKCEVMFVLNMVTHTLDENLQALKKAQNLGIPVHYVELGNEYNNINSPGRTVYPTATDYANACAMWIDSITQNFDSVKYCAIGENKGYKGAENWNSDVLKVLGKYNVALSWHAYPNPNDYVFQGMIDFHKMDSVIMADYHIAGFDKVVNFWVTEFNTKNSDKQGSTETINPDQQTAAVIHLAKLLTQLGAKVLCVHNIVGKEGVFSISKNEIVLQPTGEAMQQILSPAQSLSKTIVGIMPYDIANAYGVNVSRQVAYAETFRTGVLHADTILLNINNNASHSYTTDTTLFKARVLNIYNILKPTLVTIENEELLTGDIKTYCTELQVAARSLPGKVTNGGLTLPELSYWYYNQTKDTAFLRYNIFRKDSLLTGLYQSKINAVQYEIDALKSLSLYALNVHYYIGQSIQAAGLIRMINFLKQYTGKQVISNECGIYAPGLLPDVVSVARATGMQYLILYSGNGTQNALSINKADFLNAVK